MDAVADSIVVTSEDVCPRDSSTRKSDRPRKLTAKGVENLSGNVGIVMQALIREVPCSTHLPVSKKNIFPYKMPNFIYTVLCQKK
jgi:hypothetical protein